MDVVSIFAHSKLADRELLFSLRSLERTAPWVRKVWVFGDRPEWLAEDQVVVEHVPHEAMAGLGRWKVPLRNTFLMTFLASLIPGLSDEFLSMADDYILLEPVAEADLCRVRVMEDLKTVARGRGLWKDALWRTRDTLVRLGYGSLNFECHVPMFLTRKWVWDAYCDLQDYVTEDRYYGLLMATAVLNHSIKTNGVADLVWLNQEGRYVGFYKTPPTRDEIRAKTAGKTWQVQTPNATRFAANIPSFICAESDPLDEIRSGHAATQATAAKTRCICVAFELGTCPFMNFDDAAWGPGIERFLGERFGEESKFER